MRSKPGSLALLAVAALALAACGGGDGRSDAERAVEQVNAGTAPFFVREFMEESVPVASCHIAPRPEREGEMLLAVITESEDWLQGTVDLDAPLVGQDITTGGHLDPQTLSMLETQGVRCAVSPKYGTVALD
jgi:hypothetical protein